MSLKVEHVSHVYMKGTPFEKWALDDVSLEIGEGEFVGIIGHTGCGKSTLVQHFNGLLRPDRGTIWVDGVEMQKGNMKELRRKVGLVFQYPEQQLFEETVFADIAFGLKQEKLSEEETKTRVLEAAAVVGLTEELLGKSIYELSGGQKRRAAIAGVIVMKPRYLILDEPAAGLDPAGRDEILEFAWRLREEQGTSVVLVSHSMDDVARMADRVIVMNDQKVVLSGTPAEVFAQEDLLTSIGLSVPSVTALYAELRKEFPDLPANVYTVEGAVAALEMWKGGAV